MMQDKPENHVTRALQEHYAYAGSEFPTPRIRGLTREAIEDLEKANPPLCLRRNQTVEDHLRYAGKVELIASLRLQYEQDQQSKPEDLGDDEIAADAEQAS